MSFITNLTAFGESVFYRCKSDKSLLKIEVENFQAIKLKNVRSGDLFVTNDASASSKVSYGNSWHEDDFVSSSADG